MTWDNEIPLGFVRQHWWVLPSLESPALNEQIEFKVVKVTNIPGADCIWEEGENRLFDPNFGGFLILRPNSEINCLQGQEFTSWSEKTGTKSA